MENKQGILSHFGGIIRFVIFGVLLIIIVFFGVRWARNRQEAKRTQEVIQSGQQVTQEDAKKDKAKSEAATKEKEAANKPSAPSPGAAPTPSGRDESPTPSPVPAPGPAQPPQQNVPQAGLGSNAVLGALGAAATTYLILQNKRYRGLLKDLSL